MLKRHKAIRPTNIDRNTLDIDDIKIKYIV